MSANLQPANSRSAARGRSGPLRGSGTLASESRQAVETFVLEVSAGKRVGQPLPAPGAIVPAPSVGEARGAVLEIRATRKPVAGRIQPPKKRRRTPSWLGSGLFHLVVIVPLGFITLPGLQNSFDFTLSLSTDPGLVEEIAISEIAIEPLAELAAAENLLAADVVQTSMLSSELDAEGALTDLSSAPMANAALSDAGAMFASNGLAEIVPAGDKLTASFFGAKVEGRRILYVLDNSGGMQDGGLETLVDELLRSVQSLSPKQEFYVIFYSDMVYPLFHPRSIDDFVPANERFKKRLEAWLDTVEFSMGNSVDQAIMAATMIRPDAVYLLTDGNIDTTRDGRKLAALLDTRGRDFPIHTFGIGMGDQSKAADNLRRVAEANRGTFRIIDVSEAARLRAKEMNRPYHSKEPGRSWGLNLGSGWGRR